jgi:hypothetical protein
MQWRRVTTMTTIETLFTYTRWWHSTTFPGLFYITFSASTMWAKLLIGMTWTYVYLTSCRILYPNAVFNGSESSCTDAQPEFCVNKTNLRECSGSTFDIDGVRNLPDLVQLLRNSFPLSSCLWVRLRWRTHRQIQRFGGNQGFTDISSDLRLSTKDKCSDNCVFSSISTLDCKNRYPPICRRRHLAIFNLAIVLWSSTLCQGRTCRATTQLGAKLLIGTYRLWWSSNEKNAQRHWQLSCQPVGGTK